MGIFSKMMMVISLLLNPVDPEPPTSEIPDIIEEFELETPAPKVDNPPENSEKIAVKEAIELGGASSTEEVIKCSCVAFMRSISSFNPRRVESAKDLPVNRSIPLIGSWAVFRSGGIYGRHGHVGLVIGRRPEESLISEYNLFPCEESQRWIRDNDPLLKGFYDERE